MTSNPWYLEISDEEMDEHILEDFPFPIAVAYQRIQETDQPEEKADLCTDVFNFGIRTVTLALIIRYLKTDKDDVNVDDLNKKLKAYLPQSYPDQWIELLEGILKAYEGHRDSFFMPQLYDLYHNPPETEKSLWQTLSEISDLTESIRHKKLNAQFAIQKEDLVGKIRNLLRFFGFISEYEMWLIKGKDLEWITYDSFNGTDVHNKNVSIASVQTPHVDDIHINKFYMVANPKEQPGIFMFELNPLLVSSATINARRYENITGIFEKYIDDDLTDDRPGTIEYMLFAVDIKDKVLEESLNKDLIAQFLYLYEHLLDQKIERSSSKSNLSWKNLRERINEHNSEVSMSNAISKYDENVYVEREAVSHHLNAYFNSEKPAIVITGDAGVGKTNLLVRYYFENLIKSQNHLALWFDGAEIRLNEGLNYAIVQLFDKYLSFLDEFPKDEYEAERILRDVFERPDFIGKTFVIVIEAINENVDPIQALQKINQFINNLTSSRNIKVIITSRPQVWRYTMQSHLKPFRKANYFQITDDKAFKNEALSMKRYTLNEQKEAFSRYTDKYEIIHPDLLSLNPRLREALREPLMLRIACEAYYESKIPADLSIYDIIPKLIEALVTDPSQTLNREDIEEFLQQKIVPLFMETNQGAVNRITRKMLNDYVVDEKHHITLDDLIMNHSKIQGQAVNQQFQNLMDTGWLTRTGSGSHYEVRFKYEYFYDYFVGKHLHRLFAQSNDPDPIQFFKEWVSRLQENPFLWGPLQNLLANVARDSRQHDRFKIIEELGHTNIPLQRDLVAHVVGEFYTDQSIYREIVSRWIQEVSDEAFAPQASVMVAVEHGAKDIIVTALAHREERVRAYIMERIYTVWTSETYDGRQLVINCLTETGNHVKLRKLGRNADFLESLINCSMVIIMNDYIKTRTLNNDIQQTLQVFQQDIWQPVINSLFKILPGRRLRRFVLRFAIGRIIGIIRNLEGAGQILLSVPDLIGFFPADDARKKVFHRMLPHLNAASNPPDLEPLDDLGEYLNQLVVKDADYLTSGLGLCVLVAHLFRDPLATANWCLELTKTLEKEIPHPKDPEHPTAPPWLHMNIFPLSNLPHRDVGQDLDRDVAIRALEIFREITVIAETKFFSAVKFPSGEIRRTTLISDPILFSYAIKADGADIDMRTIVDDAIKRKDHKQIRRFLAQFAEGMSYHNLPDEAIELIYEYLTYIQPYLNDLKLNNEQGYKKYWDSFVENMILYGAAHKSYLETLVSQFENEEIPDWVKIELLNAEPKEDFGYVLAIAGLQFVRYALKDEDPSIRNIIIRTFENALDARTINEWVLDLTVYLANLIYGDILIAE